MGMVREKKRWRKKNRERGKRRRDQPPSILFYIRLY